MPVMMNHGFTNVENNMTPPSTGYPQTISDRNEIFSNQGVSTDAIIATFNAKSKVSRVPTCNRPCAILSKTL